MDNRCITQYIASQENSCYESSEEGQELGVHRSDIKDSIK